MKKQKQKVRRSGRQVGGDNSTIDCPRFYDTFFTLLGKLYLIQDAKCIRFPVTDISALGPPDDGFPKSLTAVFRNLPEGFEGPPDEVFTIDRGPNVGWKVYYFKGDKYVRYAVDVDSDGNGEVSASLSTIQNLPVKWGLDGTGYEGIRSSFDTATAGLDASGKQRLWFTKGSRYLQYKKATYARPDAGFPKSFDDFWGVLPAGFGEGFDSTVVSESNQLYVFSEGEYIKYADPSSSEFEGPLPLATPVVLSGGGQEAGFFAGSYRVTRVDGVPPNGVQEEDTIDVQDFGLGTSLGFSTIGFPGADASYDSSQFVTYAYERSSLPSSVKAMYQGGAYSFRFYVEGGLRKMRCSLNGGLMSASTDSGWTPDTGYFIAQEGVA